MRLIPKNTKVRIKFYKNIGIADIVIGLITLGLIALVVSSNFERRFIYALGVAMIAFPLFISIGEVRLYKVVYDLLRYSVSRKKYGARKRAKCNSHNLIPYNNVEENLLKLKDGSYVGVVEVTPIEFNMLSEQKQNFLIDGQIANIFRNIGLFQTINLIKLEKPMIFDEFVKNEYERINEIVASHEHGELNEDEFRKRVEIIEDRIGMLESLSMDNLIYMSAYYVAVVDKDKQVLQNTVEIIENTFKANGINAKRLNNNELSLFVRYSFDHGFEQNDLIGIEPDDIIYDAVPNKLRFNALSTRQGNKTLSHFVITEYPLKVDNGWGQVLFDLDNTKVVLKAKPVEKYKATKRIDNAINEIVTQNTSMRTSSQIDKGTHIETLQDLLEGLQNNNEAFFDVNIIVTVYDDLKQTTNKKNVKRRLRELGFRFTEMYGRQLDTYLASNISFLDNTKISRGLNATTIAAAFPFVSNAIIDPKGVLIGENKLPAMVDFFRRDEERVNSNMIIIGKSGSGKSFATKTILSHLASDNAKVFILDPENEYGNLAKNMKGKVLDVSSSREGRINPFHVITALDDENEDGTSNSFFAHLQFLEEFFKLIMQGIDADSLEMLNKEVLDVYTKKGITGKTDFTNLQSCDYPTFQDVACEIENKLQKEEDEYSKECLKVLANYLSKFKEGGRNSALWNGYTTFNPSENFVCFDFQKLLANKNNTIANAQMLLVLKWLDNEVIKNRDYNTLHNANRKIVVAIDEAHVFIDTKFPIALDFMYQLAKRIRKYNGMQIVITQNVKDFVGSPEIARKSAAIINVSQYSMIFSLAPNDMSDLCQLYEKAGQINDAEADNIVNLTRGNAFFIFGSSNRTNIKIVATPLIKEIFEKQKKE